MDKRPVITLDQLAGISIEELLGRALQEGTLTVQFPDGAAVTIQPKPALQPLPVLEGYVLEEWKDEIRTCEAGFLKR
jgi:hypothetical protein